MTRLLLVDDDTTQRKLSQLRLIDAGFDVQTACGADDALLKARAHKPDAILSDVLMPDLDGFTLCRLLREDPVFDDVPVILLSAHYQGIPDQALATRVGASALVARTPEFDAELAALDRSLRTAVPAAAPEHELYEEQMRSNATQVTRLLEQARTAEQRYRTLFEHASHAITVLTPDGVVLEANERWSEILGFPASRMVGHSIREWAASGSEDANVTRYQASMASAGSAQHNAVPVRGGDGRTIYMNFSVNSVELDGQRVVLSIGHDVTQELRAAASQAATEQKYRTLVERIPDVIWTSPVNGLCNFVTPNIEAMLGYTPEEFCDRDEQTRNAQVHPDDLPAVVEAFRALHAEGRPVDLEYRRLHKNGTWIWVRNRVTCTSERDGAVVIDGMLSDVTERRRLEDTIRQAQKMEALGQLTGGIAHDFNNLLAAILANSHFLIEDLGDHDPRREYADEVKLAAERAAALTRQLLAFSRRQVLEPCVIDLNSVVVGMEKMLRRLIGEDVELVTELCPGPGTARVDIGQLEQVILNLVVNARDAMPAGGPIQMATRNVTLDATSTVAPPGRYVLLTVTDAGVGMDAETRQRIFEPFFTTKAPGKGTGLGLSTCYGIVKQSGGHIAVTTALGAGTKFEIYLPRVDARPDRIRRRAADPGAVGTELVLLIEDDEPLRRAIARILEPRGYRLLIASNGAEALAIAKRQEAPIDLVLSDVVMPGLSGPRVVAQLRELGAAPRTLFMSGYTSHGLLDVGALQTRPNFIQKPFAPQALLSKLREVLDAPVETD